MNDGEFEKRFLALINNQENPYHPLVWINGTPTIGKNTYIGGMSEINAKGASVNIGSNCDIASFVAINVADSHLRVIGVNDKIDFKNIIIENNVFIGSHSAVLGGSKIGHNSVVAAGSIVRGETIPPFSLAIGNPLIIKDGYYQKIKI